MYSFYDNIRYSEVDKNGKLSIPSAVNYLQDCCTKQSEDLGIGLHHLQHLHKVWVLSYWQIDFLEDIGLGDEIEVGTWAYDAKGFYGYRNFLMQTREKKPLIKANSLWVLLNTQTGRPERVTDADVSLYGKEKCLDMEYLDRKIKVEGEGRAEKPFPVCRYHIDTNDHVNNSWYIQFAMEYLPEEYYKGKSCVKRLRVEYKHSALYGDMIYPVIYQNEQRTIVSLNNEENRAYAVIELSCKNK